MPRLFALLTLTGCTTLVVEFGEKPGETGPDEVVSGALGVSPTSADLGVVFVGDSTSAVFNVENVGDSPLALTTAVDSAFGGAWALTLLDAAPGPGVTTTLTMTLTPTAPGDHAASVTLTDTSGSDGLVVLALAAIVQEDFDGDGVGSVASGGADCDDDNPGAWPGAEEIWYDGIDQDCAGGDDFDQDGDGATVDTDCDDTDATVLPGATDPWYDGIDQDCLSNDDFDQDADGIQYGADCDDANGAVYPGNAETWYDGIDQDCDGGSDYDQDHDGQDHPADCDDTDPSVHAGASDAWYDGVDSDCLGNDDDDQDADGVRVASDCDDTDAGVGAPTAERWNGLDDDCDGAVDNLAVASAHGGVLYGSSTDCALGASHTIALGGDIDGDGGDDLVAVSPQPTSGAAWVVSGPDALLAAGPIEDSATAYLYVSSGYPPAYVSGPMSDLTGDGRDDVLLNGVSTYFGASILLDGASASGTLDLVDANTAYVVGDSDYDVVRWSVGGDIDGDGSAEWVTGAIYESYSTGTWSADYYVGNIAVFGGGGFSGAYDLDDADDQIWGADDYDYLGTSLAIGDVTGDGYADILAGASGNDDGEANAGAVYVFLGGALGWLNDRADVAAYTTVLGTSSSQGLGGDPLPTPGDLDGDGALDLALSATTSGKAWVFFDLLDTSGSVDVTAADAIWTGTANSFPSSLAAASDLDDDGIDDLAIGASSDDTVATNAGAVFLFRGGGAWHTAMTTADADVSIVGAAAYDGLGTGLAAGGDLDSDGADDLLMGASGVDSGATGGGAIYVLLGIH
ncbi:MAG: MopE-related protein [Pseudomonadota bacterium]|nr:MopE-related protein [Pseudomonadota bacterium]